MSNEIHWRVRQSGAGVQLLLQQAVRIVVVSFCSCEDSFVTHEILLPMVHFCVGTATQSDHFSLITHRLKCDPNNSLAPTYRTLFNNVDRTVDNDGYENELPLHLKTISIGGLPVEEIPCVEVYDLSGKVSLYVLVMEMWLVWVAGDWWCAVLARIVVTQIRYARVIDTTVEPHIHSESCPC
jgi:hypothetical protein